MCQGTGPIFHPQTQKKYVMTNPPPRPKKFVVKTRSIIYSLKRQRKVFSTLPDTVNQDDVHPVIGESNVPGLWACNGFSGHGFKLAPAVGSLVAQQITGLKTDAWETSVAHDFMGPGREPLTLKVKTHFA